MAAAAEFSMQDVFWVFLGELVGQGRLVGLVGGGDW